VWECLQVDFKQYKSNPNSDVLDITSVGRQPTKRLALLNGYSD